MTYFSSLGTRAVEPQALDLYPVFLECSDLAALFYHHSSEDAYRLVGERIADYLSRSGHPRRLASSPDR